MRALLIPVDGLPTEIDLRTDEDGTYLRAEQAAVGGRLEAFAPLEDEFGASVYVNDEGMFNGQPANRAVFATEAMKEAGYLSQKDWSRTVEEDELYTVLYGPILVTGHDGEDLTDEQVARATRYFTEISPARSGYAAVDRMTHKLDTSRHEGKDYADIQGELVAAINEEFGGFFDLDDVVLIDVPYPNEPQVEDGDPR